jgi:hypothetical protein
MESAADISARWAREPRRKVGAVAERIIVVALDDNSPGFDDKLRALEAEKTAALHIQLHVQRLFFFKAPPAVRWVDTELVPGVEVLVEGYDHVELPSSSPLDTCHWINNHPIARAPQWLLDRLNQLGALVPCQSPTEGIDAVSADADADEMSRSTSNTPLPASVQERPVAAEESVNLSDQDQGKEECSSEIKTDTSGIEDAGAPVVDAPSIAPSSTPERSTKLDSALDLISQGFRVFPLIPNSKKPAIEKWQHRASHYESDIRQWWEQWPDANPAIVTDDLAVMDIDVRKISEEKITEFVKKYLPEENKSLTARTWSGGKHVLYQLPPKLKLSSQNDAFAEGIDLKTGSGAYIVGVGSTIVDGENSGEYTWANTKKIRVLPEALIQLLQERKKLKTAEKSAQAGERLIQEDDEAVRLATDYIENHAPEAREGNRGDETTFKVLARLFDFGISKNTAHVLAQQYNETKCFPPWDGAALAQKVESAYRNRQNPIGKDHPTVIAGEWPPEELDERGRALSQGAAAQSAEHFSEKGSARKPLKLAPFKPVAPSEIPPREWLIHGMLCRRNISFLAGPSGVSKTTLLLMVALALATGRGDILGMPIIKRSRVSFWNQEDPIDELQRRVAAICMAFGMTKSCSTKTGSQCCGSTQAWTIRSSLLRPASGSKSSAGLR